MRDASPRRLLDRARVLVLVPLLAAGCIDDVSPPPDPPAGPSRDLSWLEANAFPVRTDEPGSDYADLMVLKEIIGDARVVALGEATYGTREFSRLKHRVLEFLVLELGFNVFGIEANWAESNLVDHYVRTGEGDPAALLFNLDSWALYAQEVLDMIVWMREHNQTAGASGISFSAFDMQSSRRAMEDVWDYVVEHIAAVDESITALVGPGYICWRTWSGVPAYAGRPATVKQECRDGVRAVHDRLAERRAEYEAASGTEAFARALRAARVVVQHEYYASRDWLGVEPSPRERYMAENAEWLLEQAGPDARIVLWAHNGHVMNAQPRMGARLRQSYGDDMVIVGFSFYQGQFTAVPFGAGSATGPPTTLDALTPVPDSYQQAFHEMEPPRFLVDVRPLRASAPESAAWLAGPLPFRSVGCCYDGSLDDAYYLWTRLIRDYDVLIHLDDTRASVLLPSPED